MALRTPLPPPTSLKYNSPFYLECQRISTYNLNITYFISKNYLINSSLLSKPTQNNKAKNANFSKAEEKTQKIKQEYNGMG